MLSAGHGPGLWNGTSGITSSSAPSMTGLTALAVAEASDVLGLTDSQTASWYGATVDATTVLVKYTWGGDANLDGVINADDYFLIDSNYNKTAGGYVSGDFDYNGRIDGDDYFTIDANFAAQAGVIGSAPLAPAGIQGAQAVPEPVAPLLALAATAMMQRRRKPNGTRQQR